MVNNKVAEAIYEDVLTSVWWDIENCPIPKGCKAEGIAQKIRSALNKLNYRGPISISAYGNMNHIPPSVKQALSSTGIVLDHVPSRKIHLHMFDDVLFWKYDNPAPANVMFISRDMNFSESLRRDGYKYNILLAHPLNPHGSFLASASATWLWRSLLEEE